MTRPNNPIDLWKGATILSVLNIHTCFWSGEAYMPDWSRQAALFLDIPVFVFISGYLLYSPHPGKLLKRGIWQIVRLLVDYWTISIAGLILLLYVSEQRGMDPLFSTVINLFKYTFLLNPDGPIWEDFKGFTWSMWYLQFYLSVLVCAIPILAVARGHGLILLLTAGLSLTLSVFVDPNSRFLLASSKFVAFYLSIFLLGAAYHAVPAIWKPRCHRFCWTALIAATVGIIGYRGFPFLQAEKFPPTLTYFVFSGYSVMIFCVLVSRGATLPAGRLTGFVCWCGANSYRVYLWQGYIASVPWFFLPKLFEYRIPTPAIYLITLTWVVFGTLTLVWAHNGLEKLVSLAIKTKTDQGRTAPGSTPIMAPAEAGVTPSLAGESLAS